MKKNYFVLLPDDEILTCLSNLIIEYYVKIFVPFLNRIKIAKMHIEFV